MVFAYGHHELPWFHNVATFYEGYHQQLLVAAVEFSEQWFDALAAHEMSHALHDRLLGLPSLPGSDGYLAEEASAHGVGRAVLDNATGGAYGQRVAAIVDQRPASTFAELVGSVTVNDLRWLDELFQPAGELEAGMRCTQYYLDIASSWAGPKGLSPLDPYRYILSE